MPIVYRSGATLSSIKQENLLSILGFRKSFAHNYLGAPGAGPCHFGSPRWLDETRQDKQRDEREAQGMVYEVE